MSGQRNKIDVLFLPVTAKTVAQEEIDALEAKRIRRLRELGDWRPSSGFHIEPTLPPEPAPQLVRTETALPPAAELSVLEGRDVTEPAEATAESVAPRRIRARRATRASNEVMWFGLNGTKQVLHRG